MAHRFDNFDDAFAELSDDFDPVKTWHTTAGTHAQAAFDGCPDPVDRTHFYRLYDAVQSIRSCLTVLLNLTRDTWDQSSFWESVYWANKDVPAGPEYELTLIKMIEAYIKADDDHRSAQRLLFDAYQASMYDKPFDREYHAQWIQRFRSWA